MELSSKEKTLASLRTALAITLIPTSAIQSKPTPNQLRTLLGVRSRLSILHDEENERVWIVPEDPSASELIASRIIESNPIEGYSVQRAPRTEQETNVLLRLVEEEMKRAKEAVRDAHQVDSLHASSSSSFRDHPPGENFPSTNRDRSLFPDASEHHLNLPGSLNDGAAKDVQTSEEQLASVASGSTCESSRKKRRISAQQLDSIPPVGSSSSPSVCPLSTPPRPTSSSVPVSPSYPPSSSVVAERPAYKSFDHLPVEIIGMIFKECFEGTESSEEHLEQLRAVSNVGRSFREILVTVPIAWTNIHPAFTVHPIHTMLGRSRSSLLSIEWYPKPLDRTQPWNELEDVLDGTQGEMERWGSATFAVPSRKLQRIMTVLASSAPSLYALAISVSGIVRDRHARFARPANSPEMPYTLLGGSAPGLRRLAIQNIPILFSIVAFPQLESLSLTDGVRLRSSDIFAFIQAASISLHELAIEDVRFIDIVDADANTNAPPPTITLLTNIVELPACTRVALADRRGAGTRGFINIFRSIRLPECKELKLEICELDAFSDSAVLDLIMPFIDKTLENSSRSTLDICHHDGTNLVAWKARTTIPPDDTSDIEKRCFHLGLAGDGGSLALFFAGFIHRILEQLGREAGAVIWLNVEDLMSGTIRGITDFPAFLARPFLQPYLFHAIQNQITTVVAYAVDQNYRHVMEFVAPNGNKAFENLDTLILHAIPAEHVHVQPDEPYPCYLEALVETISLAYLPPPPGKANAPADLNGNFVIELWGSFAVSSNLMGRFCEDWGEWARVGLDAENATIGQRPEIV